MIKTSDGTQVKRTSGIGDRQPLLGGRKLRALYTSVSGGETSLDLSLLTPAISYVPGNNQISVKRSSGGNPISGIDFYELTASSIGFPISDPLLAGETVEITLDFLATGVMACTPRPDVYSDIGTVGQTLVTANFSWPYNLNSGSGIGAVKLIIEGIIQTRGSANDYTEVSLGTANTNQILLTTALLGGEKIIILPTYQMIDQSAAASTFYGQAYSGVQNTFGAGTQAFIDQSTLISAPNTTIIGRAQIPDLVNDLRASLGVERIPVQQIQTVQNEYGPNGEPVSSVLNDDRGLIRFIGTWTILLNAGGQGAYSTASGDTIEVTFYGTGLNMLNYVESTARTWNYAVDGGSPVSGTYPANGSGVLSGRGYTPNQVLSVVSGLSLGIHTVKIIATSTNIIISGFEILNVNASGLMNVNPGTAYKNGVKYTNTLVDSVAYNTGVTGTTGGRMIRYMNADGSMGQAFTAVGTSPAYLASTDHSNEEVARVYYWREFGCGNLYYFSLSNDFSRIGSSTVDAVFTLEDNVTTLAGYQVSGALGELGIVINNTNNYFIFTFVGTGVDFFGKQQASPTDLHNVTVDGVSQGNLALVGNTLEQRFKICSGLPYGVHTVKFTRTALVSGSWPIKQFIVYQPKKPSIPSTAIEICDYNILADFVANTTQSILTRATGITKKTAMRDWVYVEGTGGTASWAAGTNPSVYIDGFCGVTDRLNAYYETTFFGTGFDLRMTCVSNASNNQLVTLNGLTLNTTNFPTLAANYGVYGSTLAFNTGTGVLNANNGGARFDGCGLWVKNLPLGKYTIRILNQNAGNYLYADTINIITPIHSYKSNLYADMQNTLPIGSQSLMDTRKTSMIKEALPGQKAWVQAVGLVSSPSTSSSSLVPMADMSVTIKTNGSPIDIRFTSTMYHTNNGADMLTQIYVDGVGVGPIFNEQESSSGIQVNVSHGLIYPVAAGTHKVDVFYCLTGGTAVYAAYIRRILTVKET